jgi:hypothetical protein
MFHVKFIKQSSVKEVDTSDYQELSEVMETIYNEAPWKWPHGLDAKSHDEVYLVKNSSDHQTVGFVGWQTRKEGHIKIGYYSVGVLQEFRGQKKAKQAVSDLLLKKAAEVDRVKALIVEGNIQSIGLAKSLNVPCEVTEIKKKASWLRSALIGTAGAAAIDAATLKDKGTIGYLLGKEGADPWESAGTLFNVATIGGGAKMMGRGAGNLMNALGMGIASTGPLTTIGGAMSRAQGDANQFNATQLDLAKQQLQSQNQNTEKLTNLNRNIAMGAGALGLGLLGVGGAHAYHKKRLADASEEQARVAQRMKTRGHINVTLPTRDPNDAETQLQIPLEEIEMSNSLSGRLRRDFLRRLHKETKERTARRTPRDPDNPTETEKEIMAALKEGDELEKKASVATDSGDKKENPLNAYAQQIKSEAAAISAENTLLKSRMESQKIQKEAFRQNAQDRARRMQALRNGAEKLSIMKNANSVPTYDPNVAQKEKLTLPKGAPMSMAYSSVAPYSINNKPADTDTTDTTDPSDLNKKLEKLQQENIDLRIKEEARKIADRQKPSVTSKEGDSVISQKLNSIKESLGGIKSASMMPYAPGGHPVYRNESAVNPRGANNKVIMNKAIRESEAHVRQGGTDGIQLPRSYRAARFGPQAHHLATGIKQSLFPAQPSQRAFLNPPETPVAVGWPDRLGQMMNYFASSQMNPAGVQNPYAW